ncbi:LytTR family DNA-binding domain-containing protein [Mumia sp.]|uniref:LytR/AlgR family response regulator transcription factor n=1 Tax=Mumia sp. TaxID=1965300 RepID=UPI00260DFC8C|nr:LytTR family DNA-binding domain-containing protein [Mumia sp.]MDD9347313.1 LytTR family DNA-binding domain-containing protein [Mumia sp.]
MGLNVLVADDEQPVLDELVYLLERDERIDHVRAVGSGADVLRALEADPVDAVFLDIAMPALSGLEVARVLARFRSQPKVVFVTAHEDHAVDAWDLDAVDYVLKPVAEDRLRESVRRICGARSPLTSSATADDDVVAVELAGVTRFVARNSVAYVEAQGDYVRLHTVEGDSHLLRTALVTLEHEWASAGFVRIHRSLLVASSRVREVRMIAGRCSVLVDAGGPPYTELQVARRHTRDLRELVQQRSRSGGGVS